MSEKLVLEAEKRTVLGKQVKQMRREGRTPAVLYGPEVEPVSLSVDTRTLNQVLLKAGGTQLIELQLEGRTIPALARAVQRDYLRGEILHVDFYRVSMNRPIRTEVPIVFVGESPAVENGDAILIHGISALTIEALPAHLPPHVEVDISVLKAVGDQILVRDLTFPPEIEVFADGEELIVKTDYALMTEAEAAEEVVEPAEVEVITERKRAEEEE